MRRIRNTVNNVQSHFLLLLLSFAQSNILHVCVCDSVEQNRVFLRVFFRFFAIRFAASSGRKYDIDVHKTFVCRDCSTTWDFHCNHRHKKRAARSRTQCKPFSLKCLFVNIHGGEIEWDRWMHWEIQNSMHCTFDSLDALVTTTTKTDHFFPSCSWKRCFFLLNWKKKKQIESNKKWSNIWNEQFFFAGIVSDELESFDIRYSIFNHRKITCFTVLFQTIVKS